MIFKRSQNHGTVPPVAIAHDYLTQRGGAERVVLALHRAYPDAPIYTTLYDPESTYPEFRDCTIITSPLNRIGIFRKNHRLALPLLPLFSSLLKVKAERALVSTTGWAHGFTLPSKSLIYCHSPARWIYLTDQYLGEQNNPLVAQAFRMLRPFLAHWDQRAAARHDAYVANSSNIQRRILNVYRKQVDIVFPPYSVSDQGEQRPLQGLEAFTEGSDYYLLVSRLLPYKNIQHAINAFKITGKKLLIIGSGPMQEELLVMSSDNIRLASNISDEEMQYAYAHAVAVLAVSFEDFGITPLEAGAFGKPTIALRAGGFLDTITEGVNGTFIEEPTPTVIAKVVESFDPGSFDPERIKSNIQRFSEPRFHREMGDLLDSL